jgi:RNA polymerase sigma-70 factor (ECF subfamily)
MPNHVTRSDISRHPHGRQLATPVVTGVRCRHMADMAPDDQRTQADFVRRWTEAQDAVLGFLLAATSDRHLADDLLQETAIALMESHHRFDAGRSFLAWAVGTARNRVLAAARARGRAPGMIASDEVVDRLAAATADDDAEEERRAQAAVLRACMASLAGRSWEVIRLHYLDGLDPLDIAQRLGLAASHIRVILHRARAALRLCVERRLSQVPP